MVALKKDLDGTQAFISTKKYTKMYWFYDPKQTDANN